MQPPSPRLLLPLLALVLLASAADAEEPALVVKLRGEGPHALRECAERVFRRGETFAPATADGSPSLDRLQRELGFRSVRALFRSPSGAPFEVQRRALRERIARKTVGPGRDGTLPDLSHVYRVRLPDGSDLEDAIRSLRDDAHVAWVQRDHAHALDQLAPLPDDPFLHSEGSWGQAFEDLWGLFRIRAPEAWGIARGLGVVVAVVDTGLDYEHPDIAANVWVNPGEDLDGNDRVDPSDWNGIDDDHNGFVDDLRGFDFANSIDADRDGDYDGPQDAGDPDPFDDRGHGTHVAGTVAAVADNGIGIAGVAPRARIMPLKGFPAEGPGRDSDLWRAVLYAAENGARVINNSWSCSPLCPDNPLAEEIVAIVHAMDVVIVTSAGNLQTDVVLNSPEKLRETITVASSGQDDRPSESFTNFGWLVDVAAPGGGPSGDPDVRIARRNILSLRSSGDDSDEFASVGEGYWRSSGTSMSAPHVAGVAALLLSAEPDLDYESVRRRIRQAALDLGPPGHDRDMGAGRLDAWQTLAGPPLPDLTAAITGPRQGSRFAPEPDAFVDVLGSAAGADLDRFELHYGRGNAPADWTRIATGSRPVQDGRLARWPIGGLEQGTYVVRLDVWARSGERFSEFLVLSLESGRFVRVSRPGAPAGAPAISGKWVVWQSKRDPDDPYAPSEDAGSNLFASVFPQDRPQDRPQDGPQDRPQQDDRDPGRHLLLSAAPGFQESASIAQGVVSWLDSRSDAGASEVWGCVLDGAAVARGECADFPVSRGQTTSLPPASAAGRIFWLDGSTGQTDVHGCRPDPLGRVCDVFDTGLAPGRRSFLRSDGSSLVWAAPGSRFALCEVDPRTGSCLERAPADPIRAASRPAASGDLLAWVSLSFSGTGDLMLCRLDPQTGACPPLLVAADVEDPTPSLSGARLVWDARTGDEASDVFFCELDRLRERCPVQRITAHHARQDRSAVDGDRVVWEDDREGPSEIHGLRLPSLSEPRDRALRAGGWLAIPIRSSKGMPLSLSVTTVDAGGADVPIDRLGAWLFQKRRPGGSHGVLFWRPGPEHVGSHLFTFAGETDTGLVARRSVRVDVLAAAGPKPRLPGKAYEPAGGSRTGSPRR